MKRSWLGVAIWLGSVGVAQAQAPVLGPAERQSPTPGPVGGPAVAQGPSPGEPGFTTQLFSSSRATLLGDMFGLRTVLGNYGISLGVLETSEVFGNASGGVRRQAAYDGLTTMTLGIDTQRAFGWDGGSISLSALQIHGRNLSADSLLTLQTASGIEATPATRLWEAWYQQAFLHGAADIKIGQQSLDQEFIGSLYAGTFLNTMMGWPVVPSYDLYAGGPAYPLSSLGVRLRARSGAWTVLGGVFDDNPSGGPFNDDSQVRGGRAGRGRGSTSTPARCSLPKCNMPGTSRARGCWWGRMRGRVCRGPTSLVPGSTAGISRTSATTIPACRWPIRTAAGWRGCVGRISASMG